MSFRHRLVWLLALAFAAAACGGTSTSVGDSGSGGSTSAGGATTQGGGAGGSIAGHAGVTGTAGTPQLPNPCLNYVPMVMKQCFTPEQAWGSKGPVPPAGGGAPTVSEGGANGGAVDKDTGGDPGAAGGEGAARPLCPLTAVTSYPGAQLISSTADQCCYAYMIYCG
jgi:hypothetical protein